MNEGSRTLRARWLCSIALAACVSAGCEPASTLKTAGGRMDGDPAAAVPNEVQLSVVDRASYDAAITKHRGRVVLVDFWATWCGPCVEQLPHTIDLAERFGKRDLAVLTVSFDDPGELAPIEEFLRSKGAGGVTNLVSQYGASPQSMDYFEIENGSVPHYKLYDRSGQLRHSFGVDPSADKQFTLADIDAAIEQLIGE
jgi:thiol-disulfide isomerase/thioredoxin